MKDFEGSLDANIILRLLVRDIPEHYEAAKKLLEKTDKQFAVSDIALIEVAFVLHRVYGLTREEIKLALEGFMALPQINCNRTMFAKALILYTSSRNLSLEDCALACYAELNNALPLYTFDKKLANTSSACKLLL